jgi:ankyrin repeat protein
MLLRSTIDEIFASCANGTLDVQTVHLLTDPSSIRDDCNHSLLTVAIIHKHIPLVESLLRYDFLATDLSKQLAFLEAAKSGKLRITELLVENIGTVDVNVCKEAFLYACIDGNLSLVQYLLKQCPNIDVNRPLPHACRDGHVHIVQELINSGADAHQHLDTNFIYNMFYRWDGARQEKQMAVVFDLLISTGLVVGEGDWALVGMSATVQFMENLLCTGREYNEKNVINSLMGACKQGNLDVVAYLIDFAHYHECAVDYNSLLKAALAGKQKEVVEYLLALNKDITGTATSNGSGVSTGRRSKQNAATVPECVPVVDVAQLASEEEEEAEEEEGEGRENAYRKLMLDAVACGSLERIQGSPTLSPPAAIGLGAYICSEQEQHAAVTVRVVGSELSMANPQPRNYHVSAH